MKEVMNAVWPIELVRTDKHNVLTYHLLTRVFGSYRRAHLEAIRYASMYPDNTIVLSVRDNEPIGYYNHKHS